MRPIPSERAASAAAAAAAAAAAVDAARTAEIDKRAIAATRDNVRATLTKLAQDMKREDVALIVLFGHSTFDGVDAKFNLVGPDLEATEWERLVNALPGRVVFVNTTAASAPFMKRLASNGRVVITATDNPAQRYQTVFPEFFSQAFEAAEVDLDKDGRVSIWEAFAYASTQVKQYYRQRGQFSVERPVLDDTGDGVGKESGESGPGRIDRQPHVPRLQRRSWRGHRTGAVRADQPPQHARSRVRRVEAQAFVHAGRRLREAARHASHRHRPHLARNPPGAAQAFMTGTSLLPIRFAFRLTNCSFHAPRDVLLEW